MILYLKHYSTLLPYAWVYCSVGMGSRTSVSCIAKAREKEKKQKATSPSKYKSHPKYPKSSSCTNSMISQQKYDRTRVHNNSSV